MHSTTITCSDNAIKIFFCSMFWLLSAFPTCLIFYFFVGNDRNVFTGIDCNVTVSFWMVVWMFSCASIWLDCVNEGHCICHSYSLLEGYCFHFAKVDFYNVWQCILVSIFLSLDSCSVRYYSAAVGVTLIYMLHLVISLLAFVTCSLYEQTLWLWSPLSIMVPWVNGSPSSH